tara:strand:- start:965 stop:3706 length:2742 start_codon:yes stop_codon:yes gene_type:complete
MNMNAVISKDGVYEPWLVKYLEIASNFYGADKDAVDVGANVGLITSVLSQLQNKANVIAFEPLSVVYDHLVENVNGNRFTNVITEKVILGEYDHKTQNINASFGGNVGGAYVTSEKVKNTEYSEEVQTISLDTYFTNHKNSFDVKILKIDVEGWETPVLKGARKTLSKHQPVVFIELNVQERTLNIENRGKRLFDKINSLFKYLFLIDRLSESLIPIKSHSDLRGSMLTGHFVEDLICFNDTSFLEYIESFCIPKQYSCYQGARTLETKDGTGYINSFSHFPDDWSFGHDFFLQVKDEKPIQLKITFQNIGPHKTNDLLINFGNESEHVTLKKEPISRIYTFSQKTINSLHVFTEKTFSATKHINPNDPRALGVQVQIEELSKSPKTVSISSKSNPAIDIINSLKEYPVKVLWEHSYKGKYDELFDVFYSFCKVGDKFISLHGEMLIETFHKRRLKESKVAKLYKCEYKLTSKGLQQTTKKCIGLGADPRMVSNNKNAYAYVIGYGEAKHPAFLYVEKDDRLHPLKAKNDFEWGKNWQPFLKNERLFIVHELSPFSIYEIDLKTYQLKQTNYVDSNFQLSAHYTNHSMFRGGANALYDEEKLIGVGRVSAQPYKHIPFLWSQEKDEAPSFHFSDFFNQISQKGFGIIDPTSFFKDDKAIYLGLACSETTWFHSQEFSNLLLVVDVENSYSELPSLPSFLSNYQDSFHKKKPNLENHIFHCDQLQHTIPYTYEYGKQSTGQKGTLVYGPYVEITKKMELEVELSYLTIQKGRQKAGVFDVCVSKEKNNGSIDFVVIAQHELATTNKEIERVRLFFNTNDFLGYKVEFRVMVEEGIELNAFHIKTKEKEKSDKKRMEKSTEENQNRNILKLVKQQMKRVIYFPRNRLHKLGFIGGRQFEVASYKNKLLRKILEIF